MFGRKGNEGGLQARIHALNSKRQGPAQAPAAAPAAAPGGVVTPMHDRGGELTVEEARLLLEPVVGAAIDAAAARTKSRSELGKMIEEITRKTLEEKKITMSLLNQRDVITLMVNAIADRAKRDGSPGDQRGGQAAGSRAAIDEAIPRIYPLVMERIDPEVAAKLQRSELARQLQAVVGEILLEQKIQLNQLEQRDLVTVLLDDMLGLGPLEPLLADESISDIMVNGPKQVYVERRGKLDLTNVTFRDNGHVMSVATRIVTAIGRRIDESTPLVDARLADGSRVNIIAPPLAIDGTSISIRIGNPRIWKSRSSRMFSSPTWMRGCRSGSSLMAKMQRLLRGTRP